MICCFDTVKNVNVVKGADPYRFVLLSSTKEMMCARITGASRVDLEDRLTNWREKGLEKFRDKRSISSRLSKLVKYRE